MEIELDRKPSQIMRWNEGEALLLFTAYDMVWREETFAQNRVTDNPSPVFIYGDEELPPGRSYENPVIKAIRNLLKIEIDIGFILSEYIEMGRVNSSQKSQFVCSRIFRSKCQQNAIMIDNMVDPTDQYGFIKIGFVCASPHKSKLFKLLQKLLETSDGINDSGSFDYFLAQLKRYERDQIDQAELTSNYFPIEKNARNGSYVIIPRGQIAQTTKFMKSRNGESTWILEEQKALFDRQF